VLRARMNAKTPIHENFSNEPHTQRFALGSEHQRSSKQQFARAMR